MEEKKRLEVINVKKTNVAAVALFFVIFLVGTALSQLAIHGKAIVLGKVYWDAILAVGVVAVGVVVHELLHALCAILFGKAKKQDIKFGCSVKQGLFYCYCQKDVTRNAYLLMLVLPVVLTGIIPLVISVFFGGLPLLAAFSLLTVGGIGDIAMFIRTLTVDKKAMIRDHAETTAFHVVYNVGEEPEGFTETTPEEEKAMMDAIEKKGAESMGVKILLIAIFVALVALSLFVLALVMKFI